MNKSKKPKKSKLPAETRRRLNALANLMEIVPASQFKMEFFECGTARCVGGWGVHCGLFPEARFGPKNKSGERGLRKANGSGFALEALINALPGLKYGDLQTIFFDGFGSTSGEKVREIRTVLRRYS